MRQLLNALHTDSVIGEMATRDVSPGAGGAFQDPYLHFREKELTEARDRLLATLTEEQKALLTSYQKVADDVCGIREEAVFTYAFKLGARTMREIMEDMQY